MEGGGLGENKEGRSQSVTGTPRLEPTRLNCEGHLFTVGPPPHAGLNQIYHWDNTVSTPPSNNKPTVCYIQIIPPSSQPHGCFCQRCPTSSLTSRLACQKTGQVTTKLQFCKLFHVCSKCKFSQIQTLVCMLDFKLVNRIEKWCFVFSITDNVFLFPLQQCAKCRVTPGGWSPWWTAETSREPQSQS